MERWRGTERKGENAVSKGMILSAKDHVLRTPNMERTLGCVRIPFEDTWKLTLGIIHRMQ